MRKYSKNLSYTSYLFLAFITAYAVFFSRFLFAPSDDAFIFLVYAKNFIQGNGLTFNGAVVEGFSSPLWVALLSIFGSTGIQLPNLMQILSTLSGIFTLFSTYYLTSNLLKDRIKNYQFWSLLPPLLLAATGDFAFYTSSGLEHILFTGLIALVFGFFIIDSQQKIHSNWLPTLLALAILTRPEGVLFAAILYLYSAWRGKSFLPPLKSGIKLIIFLAPILIIKRIYYGYWLPNTYFIKSGNGFANSLHGKIYLIQNAPRYIGIIFVFSILVLLSLREKPRKDFFRMVWLISSCLIWGAYIFLNGGDNLVGGRVLLPVLPLVYACLIYMLAINKSSLSLALIITFALAAHLTLGYTQDDIIQSHILRWKRNFEVRQKAGIYLKDNFPPDTLIALNPAGIIPFYSELPTIDMLGKNDIFIAHYGKRDFSLPFGHQAGDGNYVLEQKPDVIFFGGTAAEEPSRFISDREISTNPEFKAEYTKKTWKGIGFAYLRLGD